MDLGGVKEEQIRLDEEISSNPLESPQSTPQQLPVDKTNESPSESLEHPTIMEPFEPMDHNGREELQEVLDTKPSDQMNSMKEESNGGDMMEELEEKTEDDPLKKLKSLKFKPMVRKPQLSKKPNKTEPVPRPPQTSSDEPIRKSVLQKEEGEEDSSGSELEEVRPKRERVERVDRSDEERPRKRKYEDDDHCEDRRREKREREPPRRAVNPQTFKKRIDLLSREECKIGLVDDGELRRLIGLCYELEFEQEYTLTTRIKLKDEMLTMRTDEEHRIRRSIETKPPHLQKVASEQYEELLRKQRGMANLHAILANPMGLLMGGGIPPAGIPPQIPPGGPLPPNGPPFMPPIFSGPPPNTQLPPPIPPTNGPPKIEPPTGASTSNPPPSSTATAPPLDFSKPPPIFNVPPPNVPAPTQETKPSASVSNDFSQPPPIVKTSTSQPPPPVPAAPPTEMPNMSVPPPTFQQPITTKPPPASSNSQAENNPWKMENTTNSTTASAPYVSSQDREFGPISTSTGSNMNPSQPPPQPNGVQPNSGPNIATMLTNLIASSIRMGNAGGPMMGSSPGRSGIGASPQKPFGSPQRPPKRTPGGRQIKKNRDRERTDSNSSGPAAAEA